MKEDQPEETNSRVNVKIGLPDNVIKHVKCLRRVKVVSETTPKDGLGHNNKLF